jgi:hypothetical protein
MQSLHALSWRLSVCEEVKQVRRFEVFLLIAQQGRQEDRWWLLEVKQKTQAGYW